MPVTLLPDKFDAEELLSIYNSVDIGPESQIYITSLDGKSYTYDIEEINQYIKEGKYHLLNECNVMNDFFKNSYVEEVYNSVKENHDISRARFMTLDCIKRGYSYHKDGSKKLHVPLTTDEDCIFLIEDVVYRLNEVGSLYIVDTLRKHTAFNLGWKNRTHLVFDLKIDLDNVRHSKTSPH